MYESVGLRRYRHHDRPLGLYVPPHGGEYQLGIATVPIDRADTFKNPYLRKPIYNL